VTEYKDERRDLHAPGSGGSYLSLAGGAANCADIFRLFSIIHCDSYTWKAVAADGSPQLREQAQAAAHHAFDLRRAADHDGKNVRDASSSLPLACSGDI
jgi:hypothetical protein